MNITHVSSGKLLLFGEHVVLYGYPAIGLSIDMKLKVTFTPASHTQFINVNQEDSAYLDRVLTLLEKLAKKKLPSGKFRFESQIPPSSGFGSSAAVCTCFAKLYADINGIEPKLQTIWDIAHRLETVFHGRPSGIDTGLSCRTGLYAFFPRPKPAQSKDSLPLPTCKVIQQGKNALYLVIGAVHRSGNTEEIIARLREDMQKGKKTTLRSIQTLGEISQEAIDIWARSSDIHHLAELANKAQSELFGLSLGNAAVQEIAQSAQRLGALATKTSGAGCGGAFYIVCSNKESAKGICEELKAMYSKKALYFAVQELVAA